MDSKELRGLCEAYSAIYDEDLRDELEEMSDEFAGIEDLTDEEIDTIVEETIDEMLEEGYQFDEVEEILESVLLEMNPYAPAGSKAARQYAKSTTASKRSAVRSAARAATVAKVKGAVKSALGKAKEAAKSAVGKAKEAGKEAKFRAVDKPVAAYATKRNLHPAAGMAARSKDPEKRRGLRAKVAADIKGRIKKKIAQAQVGAYNTARKAGQAASDVAGRAKQSANYTAVRTKRGVKKAIGAAASGVASGASRVAARMATEEVDIFDIVLEFLQTEGYAETLEEAEWMMANVINEEAIGIILGESALGTMAVLGGMAAGRAIHGKLQARKAKKELEGKRRTSDYLGMKSRTKNVVARDRRASGDTRNEEYVREDFEKWYAKQMIR